MTKLSIAEMRCDAGRSIVRRAKAPGVKEARTFLLWLDKIKGAG